MKKIILLIIILISSYSYYGAVNEKGERIYSYDNLTKAENVVEEQEKKTEDIEQVQEQVSIPSESENNQTSGVVETQKQENSQKADVKETQRIVAVSSQPVEEKRIESNTEPKVVETPKVQEQVIEQPNEQPKQEKEQQPVQEKPVVNETKYVRNDAMIERIRQVINNNATEDMKKYGYNIVVDSSIKNSVNQFTFTENRVKNMIQYSFGTIKIYAEDYYSNGQLIMTECYIL
ncbi:MAG: hypothetical protein IKF97_04930 [Clostridia bacterium]|nr:hypothetical protein [Clostridia bacterium]